MTNRPTYAPERRAGDTTNLEHAARTLVAFHLTIDDARTIAALIDSGAAALELAPLRATNLVEAVSRANTTALGYTVAGALRTEADRIHDRNEWRPPRRRKKNLDPLRAMEGIAQ